MNHLTKAYYMMCFKNNFARKTENAFQDFFSDIMELCYPVGDFLRFRPWGKAGDRKNDGYLISQRMLFQVYAPNSISAAAAIKKINEDYTGAKSHWKRHFDTWVFVHNSLKGLSPDVGALIMDLNLQHPPKVITWGQFELEREVESLDETSLSKLFGFAPNNASMLRVGYKEIQFVLEHVARVKPITEIGISPVPQDKLEYNKLSDSIKLLLSEGMKKSGKVGQMFQEWSDQTYGDQISSSFKQEYIRLKYQGLSPDQIFFELKVFTGGERQISIEHESATLAVLAYFFESCDIFEKPTS